MLQELRHNECASLLKEGMANIIGTPRSTPFFRRCLKPGEELREPQRPMYKPDSAYNSQQVYTESQNHFVHSNNMHRGRVGSMSSIGSGGYHSDANSHHSASSGYPIEVIRWIAFRHSLAYPYLMVLMLLECLNDKEVTGTTSHSVIALTIHTQTMMPITILVQAYPTTTVAVHAK